jgi:hypothetical protein
MESARPTVPPLRRFVGTIALVTFVIVYAFVALVIGNVRFGEGSPMLPQMLYYAVAGLAWIVPAGWLIRWMYRPPRERGTLQP